MASIGGNQVRDRLAAAFGEFNRQSRPSKGRKYPESLRKMVREAAGAGLSKPELMKLTGMSDSALRYAVDRVAPNGRGRMASSVRRLEVVTDGPEPACDGNQLTIRLPSGISRP